MSLVDLFSFWNLFEWCSLMGIIGFFAMLVDKGMSLIDWDDRISEKTLFLIAFAGGFWGIMLGGFSWHHKTAQGAFWVPVVVATILWAVFFLYAMSHSALRFP